MDLNNSPFDPSYIFSFVHSFIHSLFSLIYHPYTGLLDSDAVENWHPRCYEELLDLPCIILLSGRERTGETFPR